MYFFLVQNISSDVALIDVAADKLQGELMDLQHGSAFIKNAKIQASTGMLNIVHIHINLFIIVDFDQLRIKFIYVFFFFFFFNLFR